jgi:Protein of unknown function (DUF2934)
MIEQSETITRHDAGAVSPKEFIQPERAESGGELSEFLKSELTACVTFASNAAMMRRTGNQELTEQPIANAEKSYATLLPFLSDSTRSQGLTAEQLEEFRAQLERIRNTLDDLDKVRRIAVLAYEFWQQRGCRNGTPEQDWFRAEREIAGLC